MSYSADDSFFSGGVSKGNGYLQNFTNRGARAIFTINTPISGLYTVNLGYANGTGSAKTLNIYVNGLFATRTTLPASGGNTSWTKQSESLNLRAGINTITYQYDADNSGGVNISFVSIPGAKSLEARGATLPYQEYEAENGSTDGDVSVAGTKYLTMEAESSGRRHVKLRLKGSSVQWTAQKEANALVIRYSMPDSAQGGGRTGSLALYVNGNKIKSVALSSHYAWVYGEYPFNDNAGNGKGHHFFDEVRVGNIDIPAGANIRLQKEDDEATVAYYAIDLIDLEKIDAAYTMPDNFVSITAFGAVPNDGGDDTQAIMNAINNAKSLGKGVWIPAGLFNMTNRINVDNVSIRGSSMWHTVLLGTNGKGGFMATGNNVTIADLSLVGDSFVRNDSADHAAFEGNFGTGSLIQNVWVEHMKVGFWLSSGTNGLYVVNGRIRDTWADGVNIAGGVQNTTFSHFNIRNTGDDAMAMWSNGASNINNVFQYNTAQLPALANTFAIYGGQDNKILDNIGSDTVTASAGINISTRFGAVPFAGTVEARRNTLNRTGGYEPNWNTSFGALWIYAENKNIDIPVIVDDLVINNSLYEGIKLSYNQAISNFRLNNVRINGAGTYGISFDGVTGNGTFSNVSITGAQSGAMNNPSNKYTVNKGEGNVGW